jgi:uroporphyrinogen III methyltransferase/synthase
MSVLFVGAGPGDPRLLTIAAREAIESADLVLFDELVPPPIRDLAKASAPYGGVDHLVEAACDHASVVRLQAGDPAIFGRLVEQMEALDLAEIEYSIIPGVTAATAAAAAARISLTHRSLGRTIALVSAHSDSIPIPDADTVVFYMGRPSTEGPAIAVENASRPDQRITRDPASAAAPSIVIAGAVAGLQSLPLYGQSVIVTRADNRTFAAKLRRLGAEPVEFPVIEIVPPADPELLRAAARNARTYDYLIFTSANGVRAFFAEMDDLRQLPARIAAIGPATREEIEKRKVKADIVPDEFVAEGLLAALPQRLDGMRILIPRAAVARDVLPVELSKRGAMVDVVEAYRTVVPSAASTPPPAANWVTFTSSSTVKNYLALLGPPQANIASIGPITSATLRMHGLEPAVEAEPYTTDGLITAILRKNS